MADKVPHFIALQSHVTNSCELDEGRHQAPKEATEPLNSEL